jgi:penicillin-binding protein 1A
MPALPPIGPAAAQAQAQAAQAAQSEASPQPAVAAGTTPPSAASPSASPSVGILLANDEDQVMDPRVAFIMTHLMKEVVEFGTGMRAKALGRPVAGKTGTTNDYRDAWFMGYTPFVVTGTWVGYDDQQTLGSGETGSAAAIPIWLDYMKEVTQAYPGDEFVMPRGVTYAWIDQKTGKLTAPGAPGAVREAFLDGTAPTESVGQGDADTGSDSEFLKEELE